MVEMKNPIKEADAHPEIGHLSLWRTDFAYYLGDQLRARAPR